MSSQGKMAVPAALGLSSAGNAITRESVVLSHMNALRALEKRLAVVAERVATVESRVHGPRPPSPSSDQAEPGMPTHLEGQLSYLVDQMHKQLDFIEPPLSVIEGFI